MAALTVVTLLVLTGPLRAVARGDAGRGRDRGGDRARRHRALRELYRDTTRGLNRVAARPDFIAAVAALSGVLIFDTLPSLFIGISMSLLLLLYRASRPYIATLGRVPGTRQYSDVGRHDENRPPEGIAILRVEGGLYFANADAVRAHVLAAAGAEDIHAVILDAETIPFIDVTAARMRNTLAGDLRRADVELLLARDIGQVRDLLGHAASGPAFRHVYPTVQAAVEAATAAPGVAYGMCEL